MRHMAAVAAAALLAAGAATPVEPQPERFPEREPDPEPVRPRVSAGGDIPDRVSLEKDSPYFFPQWERIGVRINGGESVSVVEFCVSEGWARTQIFHGGRPKMERGRFVTVRRNGTIEPYWRSRA